MSRVVCIAGLYDMAIKGLDYLLDRHGDETILALPHASDDGIDRWRPSFRRFVEARGVRQTTIDEAYKIAELVFVSLGYPDIIRPHKFRTSELFNIHPSLLPKYRGMFTSTMPILFGETRCGATLHRIDAGIDTGDIIAQSPFEISIDDTARDLYYKHQDHCSRLFPANIASLLSRTYRAKPQPAIGTSYFSKKAIDFSSLTTDLNKTAFQIHNQFRSCIFREYQLPSFGSWQISRTEITPDRSRARAGTVVTEDEACIVLSSTDFDVKLHKDHYPLLWASAGSGDLAALTQSLRLVEDVDLLDKEGRSALMIAASAGNCDVIAQLLTHGARLSSASYMGTTALKHALDHYQQKADRRAFDLLLRHGADPRQTDKFGRSVVDYMRERDRLELLPTLAR